MSEDEKGIFIDKISLSSLVIDKKGQLIGNYNDLILRLRLNEIRLNEISNDSYALTTVRNIKDLFDMIKYKKIVDLKKANKSIQEKEIQIQSLVNKFSDMKSKITIKDIDVAYENILQIITLSGYDNDETKSTNENNQEAEHW